MANPRPPAPAPVVEPITAFSIDRSRNKSFSRGTQATSSFNGENVGLVDDALLETRSKSSNFFRITSSAYINTERRTGNGNSVVEYINCVAAYEC